MTESTETPANANLSVAGIVMGVLICVLKVLGGGVALVRYRRSTRAASSIVRDGVLKTNGKSNERSSGSSSSSCCESTRNVVTEQNGPDESSDCDGSGMDQDEKDLGNEII